MVDVPKFNFNNSTVKSDEELKSLLDSDNKSDKYFRPGNHEVTITGVEYKGPASDSNWGKFVVSVAGTGGKTQTGMVFVPFKDIQYTGRSGKVTPVFYKRFAKFMDAVGIPLSVQTLGDTCGSTFGKPEKSPLVGTSVVMELGYDGNYVKYDGKDEAGIKKYVIAMKDGSTIKDTFPSFDAANAYAEQNQIAIQDYPQILSWTKSSTPNRKVAANW